MSARPELYRLAIPSGSFAAIDRDAGVIRGVAVITVGPALGHNVRVDGTTLAQVKACAETYEGGLKVKISTQRGHLGDFAEIAAFLTNFRIEGDKLLADLNLLNSSEYREHILEVAEKIPDTFGLSIEFSGVTETVAGTDYARCAEIYGASLVSEPAANPQGLFDVSLLVKASNPPALPTQPTIQMDEKQIKDIVECAVKAAFEPLSARLSKLETPPAPAASTEEDEKAMSEKRDEALVMKALKAFSATFGTPPAAPSNEPAKPAAKKFEELVREHAEYSKNKGAAVKAVVRSNPTEYADYNRRLSTGEVILF